MRQRGMLRDGTEKKFTRISLERNETIIIVLIAKYKIADMQILIHDDDNAKFYSAFRLHFAIRRN